MTLRTVATEIDRLDALSRTRELSDYESSMLYKLITVQRKYERSNNARETHRQVVAASPS